MSIVYETCQIWLANDVIRLHIEGITLKTSTPSDIGRALYVLLKQEWLKVTREDYALYGRPMVPSVEPWQVWRVDPRSVPPLVYDENDRPANFVQDTVHTKVYPYEQDIRRKIRFRPAIVMSTDRLHQHQYAWACPITRTARGLSSEVEIATQRHDRGVALLNSWRCLSTDTNTDDPELLCLNEHLRHEFQMKLADRLKTALSGDTCEPSGPQPGALVRAKPPYSVVYEGVVVGGWKSGGRVDDSTLIVCQTIPSAGLHDLTEEYAASRGLVLLRDAANPARPPFVFAPFLIASIASRSLSTVGHLGRALPLLNDMILKHLATPQ